ncbi:MAG: chloride channel protein [Thermoanaerobaculum sp.]
MERAALGWPGRLVRLPARSLALAAGVGAAAGAVSVGFWDAIAALWAVLDFPVRRFLQGLWPVFPATMIYPAVGAALAVAVTSRLFRFFRRPGVPTVMLDARNRWAKLPGALLPATFVGSVLTIGSGGSAGREAPVVAMGGTLGAVVARALGLLPRQRQMLVACGTSAAVAAAFNAPLAGVFFTLELVLGDFRVTTLAPVMVASVSGTIVCRALEGSPDVGHFRLPPFPYPPFRETLLFLGLGILAAVIAELFSSTNRLSHRLFSRLSVAPELRAALGGLGVGALALAVPQVLGNGYEWIVQACAGELPWQLMATALLAKIVATSLTLGSGGWGGDLAPLLFLGAMGGGAYGSALAQLGLSEAPAAFSVVGMGAVLAAGTRAALTSMFLVLELTGSYQVVPGALLAIAAASLAARSLRRVGMYHREVRELGGPAYEVQGQGLASIPARHLMRPEFVTLQAGIPLGQALPRLLSAPQVVFPVVDADGRVMGAVRLAAVKAALWGLPEEAPVVAADLAEEVPFLTPAATSEEAAELLALSGVEELVVVDPQTQRPVGLVDARDILRAAFAGEGVEVLGPRGSRN